MTDPKVVKAIYKHPIVIFNTFIIILCVILGTVYFLPALTLITAAMNIAIIIARYRAISKRPLPHKYD